MPFTVTPDKNGAAGGTTPASRLYALGTSVTLTAPATVGGLYFSGWSGADYAGRTTTFTMGWDRTVTAIYKPYAAISVGPSFLGTSGLTGDVTFTTDTPDVDGVSTYTGFGYLKYHPADPTATTVTIAAPSHSLGGKAWLWSKACSSLFASLTSFENSVR